MAGYMTKMIGNVYEGEMTNGTEAAVANGTLLTLGTDGLTLVLPAADSATKLVAKEKTTIYDGIPAVRYSVQKLEGTYYLVENGFDGVTSAEYDARNYEVPVGAFLRAHPLAVGDEFVVATEANVTVGTAYGVKADGTVG